jgi:hypothetical protein
MHRRTWLFITLLAGLLVYGGCGPRSKQGSAGAAVRIFYESQENWSGDVPSALFAEERIAVDAAAQIRRREMAYGRYLSGNRIGTSRRMSIEGRGRRESITYIYEVTCEHGRTRETLMISRTGTGEPYLITAYVIENIPRVEPPAPDGTSTT